MNFGEKLRDLRNEKKWTQPELADAIGIEQSYLSKLENERSMPSGNTLSRILEVFEIEIGELLCELDQRTKNQLRQLPQVADFLTREKSMMIQNRRRWLIVSVTLISIGVALIYGGRVHLFFPDNVYQYVSRGIVLEGEPKEIFEKSRTYLSGSALQNRDEAQNYLDAIKARVNEHYVLASEYRGTIYNLPVDGGSRTYYFDGERQIDPWQSKFLVFIGVLLGMFGLAGIVMERKLSN
ncbi:MAG: helix-turn-helix transcriptional regulator [Gammaproteobacteria bacterium]|nr:helix-turn-helix transcriptional regulator [Gammaproteobacteria bacterium]